MTRRASGGLAQPDLFGEWDAAVDARSAAQRARDEWAARFEAVTFPSPYDTAGAREGELVTGLRCPACSGVEWNGYLLSINHGYDPGVPDRVPGEWAGAVFGETCTRLITREFRAAQGLPVD